MTKARSTKKGAKSKAQPGKRRVVAGGAATGGGINFQAAVTAITYAYMATGRQLSWLEKLVVDVPVAVEAETNGPGDDLFIRLASGESVEIQVKKGLRVGSKLWGPLLKLAEAISKNEIDYGILVISPSSSATISDDLCGDVIRLGDGRTDALTPTAKKLVNKLSSANLPLDVCRKIRIKTVSAVTGNDAHIAAARSELALLCNDSSEVSLAWDSLTRDASSLIEQRGRRDASSVVQLLAANNVKLTDGDSRKPALLLNRLCAWVYETNRRFSVFGVQKQLQTDVAWIPLEAVVREEKFDTAQNLEEALKLYHSWDSRYGSRDSTDVSTETLAHFVPRVVLLGGPGMGKTTLLKRIARRYSEQSIPVLTVKLQAVAALMHSGSTFHDAVLAVGLDGSGIDVVEARNAAFPNWLLLCDGLDECGKLQAQISEGIARFAEGHTACRIIITARPIGYDSAHFDEWRHYHVKPLSTTACTRNLADLVSNLAPASSPLKDRDQAYELCSKELKDGEIRNIVSRTPLMLGLAASIILQGGKLGKSREQLFEKIFDRIDEIPNTRVSEAPAAKSILSYFLNIAGWELVTKPISDVSTFLSSCANWLSKATCKSDLNARADAEAFLLYWQNAGLIEKVGFGGKEVLVFIHKNLGEFAAARWVCSITIDQQRAELSTIIDSPKNFEVVRFVGLLGDAEIVCELLIEPGEDNPNSTDRISLAVELVSSCRNPPTRAIRKAIIERAIAIANCDRRDLAFNACHYLPAIAERFPDEVVPPLKTIAKSDQDWTQLIYWATLSSAGAGYLDHEELLDSFVSIAKNAGSKLSPSLGGGLDVMFDRAREREVLESFLINAADLLLERDAETHDLAVRDALNSEALHTGRFIDRANALLKSKGKGWQLPGAYSSQLARALLSPKGYEEAQLKKFEAIFSAFNISSNAESCSEPLTELLYFSAFLQVSRFWEMPAAEAWAWVDEYDKAAIEEVLTGIALVSGIDLALLRADLVQARASLAVKGADALLEIATKVDPPEPVWESVNTLQLDIKKLEAGMLHPSQWVVMLAAQLLFHSVSTEQLSEIVRRLFEDGNRHTLWAASVLATSLGRDEMLSMTANRLSRDLRPGCEYLFELLIEQKAPLDENLYTIVQKGLRSDVDIAVSSAKLAGSMVASGDEELARIVADGIQYWEETEDPYPVHGGAIPKSPRADLLAALYHLEDAKYEDLKLHLVDARTDVQEVATKELVSMVAKSQELRMEFLNDVDQEMIPAKTLRAALPIMKSLTKQEWDSIAKLFSHSDPHIRYAAMGALEQSFAGKEMIEIFAKALTADTEQEIVERAYRILDNLKSRGSF